MSTDAVAIIGFVVLFVLMLLRVPVGMAMGLVGVAGFGYLVGGGPALKMVGQTSMRTVTDYTFGVIPMFLLMGAFATTSGMSRELFRAANAFVGHLRGGLGIATIAPAAALPRSAARRSPPPRPSPRVAYPEMRRYGYPQIVRHRRDRRRRHARHHDPALDRARGLRPHHRSRTSASCSWPASCRACSPMAMYMATITHHRLRAAGLPAGRRRAAPGASASTRCATSGRRCCCSSFVIGGLYGGLFTPTEAGGVGAGGAFLIGVAARPAVARRHPALAAAGDAHRGGGVHRADRRHPVRLFPHHHADAAEGDRVPHRPRHRPLRRAGADHADVSGARLPDGRAWP